MKNRAVQLNMFHNPAANQYYPRSSENPIHRYRKDTPLAKDSHDTFESFLLKEFHGEKVMDGDSYSAKITKIMRENLEKI